MLPDRHLPEQRLVRAAEDADAGAGAIGGEEQVVLLVDQHAGDARQALERAQERPGGAVDHVDPVGAGVGDVQARAARAEPDVGVVETPLSARRQRDEDGPDEAHAIWLPASTSALHQA